MSHNSQLTTHNKNIILKAENISKQYRLGTVGTGTLKHDLNRWWHQIRGKEDPYLKIGDINDRSVKGESDYVWALQDINFEVERGEVLGIIGKNGAGKSTLLKILSRVTAPTTGSIKFGGRVASLLEVGTGFNGEMTGRENIFLNGAILGMTKKEIASKLDEIIEFSGCERYIDTPVKRYSSGMYVRLAFAVAAFLEPEILIVDEVLAVGDAEFQKKAIGKMQDISKGEGRTVLFVSHNMDAVLRICSRSILMKNGKIINEGSTSDIVEQYLKEQFQLENNKEWESCISNCGKLKLLKVLVHDELLNNKSDFKLTEKLGVTVFYEVLDDFGKLQVALNFFNSSGVNVFDSHETKTKLYDIKKGKGIYKTTVWIPSNLFSEGVLIVGVALVTHDPFIVHIHEKEIIAFNMVDVLIESPTRGDYVGNMRGMIRPLLKWETNKVEKNDKLEKEK